MKNTHNLSKKNQLFPKIYWIKIVHLSIETYWIFIHLISRYNLKSTLHPITTHIPLSNIHRGSPIFSMNENLAHFHLPKRTRRILPSFFPFPLSLPKKYPPSPFTQNWHNSSPPFSLSQHRISTATSCLGSRASIIFFLNSPRKARRYSIARLWRTAKPTGAKVRSQP